MTLKTYTQAPLPFTGQKRRFLKPFKALLNDHIPDDGTGWIILDAFGGSGLLAHVAKRCKPAARVIYNDYDGYTRRLIIGYQTITANVSLNKSATYEDNLVYHFGGF
nr:hypothetical protein [Cardiobacterium hominis]